MSGPSAVVHDAGLADYDFGAGHPMTPVRVELTMRLAEAFGVLDRPGLVRIAPEPATIEDLALVHDRDYIAVVEALSREPGGQDIARGLGTDDDPVFAGMHDASRRVVGASLAAARAVLSGDVVHAVNISGGLHHAMADRASGFCIYNDVAVAIGWLLGQGVERIAYVDVDAHHGDGVQAAFYDDPRVLTISLHESPRTLFPGTGTSLEIGGPHAQGFAVNVPLPPETDDAGWLRAFHAVVPDLLREFRPQILVSQHGCDSHRLDPLTHLALTVDGQRAAHLALHDLAHEVCAGRWLATGGGGYAVVDVVPRSWTHLLAIVTGEPLAPDALVPAEWVADVVARTGGQQPPLTMTDGGSTTFAHWSGGYNPASWLDRSIAETRQAVFPLHGLYLSE
jgi:acetoin utilization protein AcuC